MGENKTRVGVLNAKRLVEENNLERLRRFVSFVFSLGRYLSSKNYTVNCWSWSPILQAIMISAVRPSSELVYFN